MSQISVVQDGTKVIIECLTIENAASCKKNIEGVFNNREKIMRMMPKRFLRQ